MLQHRSPPKLQRRMRDRYLAVTAKRNRTEHSIRPVSSALFSNRYDGFKADRVQTLSLEHIGLYARRPVRCVPLTQKLTVACD
ncbi:hypothetical protein TNCV_4448261 [Trichonephila clavipes]|nr:hypothetical protein TNCV_4448261 [Trichonephila clavipes]